MNRGDNMLAVVLSGGGSKGAYQIGVWKALRKLHIKYDIVTGTSIGALNAALMTQKDYYRALWIWNNLDFNIVLDEKIDFDYKTKEGKIKLYKMYAKGILNGGMNISKLEKTVDKAIDTKKIYNSDINLGIITVKYPSLKHAALTKSKIPKSKLKDYLIASASCFPAFQKKQIDGENYIDGGFYDNLPINLAIEMGATKIIAVDLNEIGLKQKVKNKNIDIETITPNNDIGSFLIFDKISAKRSIKLGYNDTLKKYEKYYGNKYTFKKEKLEKFYIKYKTIYLTILEDIIISKQKATYSKLLSIAAYKRLLTGKNEKTIKKEFLKIIENLGTNLEIDETNVYSIKEYNHLILKKYKKIKLNEKIGLLSESKLKVANILNKINDKELINLAILYPKEFLQAVYVKMLLK